jgi:hypothetical protein
MAEQAYGTRFWVPGGEKMDVKRVTVPTLLPPGAHRASTRLPIRSAQAVAEYQDQTNSPNQGVANNQVLSIGISG